VALHLGDIVEVKKTKRRGKIDVVNVNEGQEHYWRVWYSDGSGTPLEIVKNEEDVILIACPHTDGSPGLIPKRGIMD
jgi:hypothetical protein